MTAIQVDGLVRDYGSKRAVDGVSFTIEGGEVYGLLGENGAGKTTTVEILTGHRKRTAGAVTVLGADPATGDRQWRARLGVVLQQAGIEAKLTVAEIVKFYGSGYPDPRPVDECLELVGLTAARTQYTESLSGGQKRRLDLAVGIVGRPELLFLDEPTTGFDPAARRGSWELIRQLCEHGTTVLLTSHYLDEVEYLADRVGVMHGGRLVAEGTPDELASGSDATQIRFHLDPELHGEFGEKFGAFLATGTVDGDVIEFDTATPTVTVHAITGWAVERRIELNSLTVRRPTLEDTFLRLVAEPLDDAGGADE